MTCEEFEQIRLDSRHHVNGDGWMLRISKAALVDAHIQSCRVCATKMAETKKLEDGLEQLRLSTMHMEAPSWVEKRLLDAFRREGAQRRPSVRRAFPWRLVWVSVATFLLVAGCIVSYSRFGSDFLVKVESGNGDRVVIQPRFSPVVSNTAQQAIDQSRKSTSEKPRTVLRPRDAAVHKAVTEPGRNRGSSPANDVLSFNGGGSIVRVTLPFSSLIAMGVPVQPELSDSRVTADVWMDPFGAVVGVRLVAARPSAD
jgi:hypothetical protein